MNRFVRTIRFALPIICVPAAAFAQQGFPTKPITFIVSYAAGATTDISARALAKGAEEILGVPITIENKGGAGGTVAAGLTASKKPDGYTLLIGSTSTLTVRPKVLKVSFKPEALTIMLQYSYFHNGSVVVNSNKSWKTIQEFIEYAKANPGMSYGTAGSGGIPTGSQQLGVVALEKCKGLTFKHVPTKGGTEANTMLMGNHFDFTSGSGSHNQLLKDGVFRQLVLFQNERDSNFPDAPTLKEIGCPWDNPPNSGIVVIAQTGMPDDIFKKLEETFTKVVQGNDFQNMLKHNFLPYDFKTSKQMAEIRKDEEIWYDKYLREIGRLK